ncbi:MAG: NAD(P)/FAD-dependent oxidoreductase [Thermoplasmata archaeon]
MEKYDLIVVGAGIVGLTSAYYLKRENKDLNILVVDKYSTYAQGNTSKAAAGFRDLFSSEPNYKLAKSSISFYDHVQRNLNFNLDMKYVGYMYLLDEDTKNKYNSVIEELEKKTKTKRLSEQEIKDFFPEINLTPDSVSREVMKLRPIVEAFVGLNCGIFEPDLISNFYYNQLTKMDVEFKFNMKIEKLNLEPVNKLEYPGEPFIWQEKRISSISGNRELLSADNFVIATDVWSPMLLDPLGIDSFTRPKKRQIFQIKDENVEKALFNDKNFNKDGILPFTIMPYGVYIRPSIKEKAFRVAVSDDIGRAFTIEDDPFPEENFYAYNIRPVLLSYFPRLESSRLFSSWAGEYSISTRDDQPYIFKVLNMIFAGATSGSGVMKGDAIGRIVSSLYSGRDYALLYDGSTINSEAFGYLNRNVPYEEFVL